MAFLTPDQIRAVRMRGSKVLKLDSLDKEIRIIKMGSNHVLAFTDLKEEVTSGKKDEADVLRYMVLHGCADLDGNPISEADAATLFDVLPLQEITILVQEVSARMQGATVKVSQRGTDLPAVKEVAEEETPAEKKSGDS